MTINFKHIHVIKLSPHLKVMLHRDDSQRNVMFVVDHYQVVYCSSILLTAKLKILTRRGIIFYMFTVMPFTDCGSDRSQLKTNDNDKYLIILSPHEASPE